MIDARRMEVFTAVYNTELHAIEQVTAKIIDAESFLAYLEKESITFIGDGAAKCKSAITYPNAKFSNENFNSASNMSTLAYGAFKKSEFEDVAYFEPFYLKDFVLTTPKAK